MATKPIAAGMVFFILALSRLLGFFSLILLSFVEPHLFRHWYLLYASVPYNFLFAIVFFMLSLGLFVERQWSYRLGLIAPSIDIAINFLVAGLLAAMPWIFPAMIAAQAGQSIGFTIILAAVEVAAMLLILKSKSQLCE
ncbi:MAG: hypothetical protein JW744_05125 [Candidatus Diapherotrites archaeon]|uniref:Uncharacterized protein n=1 Tax=Candidatus Iainarchaeum sp. TaxID=3101447 RepID=A0A938YPB9_9ARCH|nr:hypothetical protein [Candidatus Diapherotrites archaeon]